MHIELSHRPGSTVADVHLNSGEALRAESGAMVSMTGDLRVETHARSQGGLMQSLRRTVLAGESFFTNTFTAASPGVVALAPSLPGDMTVHMLSREHTLFVQGGGFVAAPTSVEIDTKWQGLTRGLLSGETFFFLQCSGEGPVLLNAFGGLQTIDLDGELVVDTGHLVAFTSGIDYRIDKAARGWIQTWLSGEGFVLRMKGKGRLYLQTRNPNAYGRFIGPQLPPR